MRALWWAWLFTCCVKEITIKIARSAQVRGFHIRRMWYVHSVWSSFHRERFGCLISQLIRLQT